MKELQEHELDHIEDDVYLLYLYTPFCGTCQLASKMLTVVKEMLPDVAFYQTMSITLRHSQKRIKLKASLVFCCLKAERWSKEDMHFIPTRSR